MGKKKSIEGYSLDSEGYYVTNEIFRTKDWVTKCRQCGNYLYFVYAEKYSHFEEVGVLMIMGIKEYGLECDVCNCGFIHNDE